MKNSKIYLLANIVSILLALSIAACGARVAPISAPASQVLEGDVVNVFRGTAYMTIEQVLTTAKPGSEILYSQQTGTIVFGRQLFDGYTVTYTRLTNLGDPATSIDISGMFMRSSTYGKLMSGLRDMGFQSITAAEVAALYTGQVLSSAAATISSMTTMFIVLPVGGNPDDYAEGFIAEWENWGEQ